MCRSMPSGPGDSPPQLTIAPCACEQAESSTYTPFIWTGFSLTLVMLLAQILLAWLFARRTLRKASTAGGVEAGQVKPMIVKSGEKSSQFVVNTVSSTAAPPPPPGPPPGASGSVVLQPGWREVLSDDGETYYYFNDETGDSQWEPPLAGGAPPPGPPPGTPPPPDTPPPPPSMPMSQAVLDTTERESMAIAQ